MRELLPAWSGIPARRKGRPQVRFNRPCKTCARSTIVAGADKLQVGPASAVGKMRRPTARKRHEKISCAVFEHASVNQRKYTSNGVFRQFSRVSTLCISNPSQPPSQPGMVRRYE
ncbi:MAG TPA: hypothetical protein VKO85_11295 [Wenzhouxiangellaceae bacterium]|nr:hypothetical protein [Wenzhouxiangellaceae bacterium]